MSKIKWSGKCLSKTVKEIKIGRFPRSSHLRIKILGFLGKIDILKSVLIPVDLISVPKSSDAIPSLIWDFSRTVAGRSFFAALYQVQVEFSMWAAGFFVVPLCHTIVNVGGGARKTKYVVTKWEMCIERAFERARTSPSCRDSKMGNRVTERMHLNRLTNRQHMAFDANHLESSADRLSHSNLKKLFSNQNKFSD